MPAATPSPVHHLTGRPSLPTRCVLLLLLSSAASSALAQSREALASAAHALSRLAYGPRPGEIEAVARHGVLAWIETQLAPEHVADQRIPAAEGQFAILRTTRAALARQYAEAQRDRISAAFEALYGAEATGLVASSSGEAFEALRQLRAANPTPSRPANGAKYPPGRFGHALLQIAQLIKADLGLEIAFADIGGWDTHVNQGADEGQLAARLTELGHGVSAFATDLGNRMSDAVVLTMSEFGRTVRENGNTGTDPGHATAMLVMGGSVRGGRIAGRRPGLEPEHRFEGRDLAVTTDFRDLFAEVLARPLGQRNLEAVFPGHQPDPTNFPGVFG